MPDRPPTPDVRLARIDRELAENREDFFAHRITFAAFDRIQQALLDERREANGRRLFAAQGIAGPVMVAAPPPPECEIVRYGHGFFGPLYGGGV